MEYYILKNGVPVAPPNPIKVTISNPTIEQYRQFGYNPKPITVAEEPEYNPETQYLEAVYTETETEIVQGWEIKETEVTADENNQNELEME